MRSNLTSIYGIDLIRVSLIFTWLLLFLWGCGSDSKEEISVFDVSPRKIILSEKDNACILKITSDLAWSARSDKGWCEVSPTEGTGSQEVMVKLGKGVEGEGTKAMITIATKETSSMIEVTREVVSPTVVAGELVAPVDKSFGVCVLPTFDWKESTSREPGDLLYTIQYSLDQKTWKEGTATKEKYYMLNVALKTSTLYYWKVITKDAKGGTCESEVRSFTTSSVEAYRDGEKFQYQAHKKGKRGVRLVVLGDGFLPRHFEKGAAFDVAVKRAVEGLFSAEPYATYREYFDVWQVAAYSKEEGAAIVKPGAEKIDRDTYFGARFVQGSSMQLGDGQAGDTKVYEFVKMALNISDDALKETIIILISNFDMYGGSCYMNSYDRKTIAICANSTAKRDEATGIWRDLEHLVAHEAGGHAIGLLADEYANEGNEGVTVPEKVVTSIKQFFEAESYKNIDLTGDPTRVVWKHFIGRPGYEAVGIYEGGQEYGKGVWRAEEVTCMDTNVLYYSAPAREAIVRRIMELCGETFDLEAFYAQDKVKANPYK